MTDDTPPSSNDMELYRRLFEEARDALVVLDSTGRVQEQNRKARALAIDVDALLVGSTPEGDLSDFRARLLRDGRAFAELRVQGIGQDAHHVTVRGEAHGARHLLVLRDVSERRRLEDELRHLRRVDSLGYMAATVVHDFNNLLVPILGLSALLASDLGEGTRQAMLAEEIQSAAQRAASLVRQMLAFVRRGASIPQRVDLTVAVPELRGLVERVVGEEVEVVFDLAPDLAETMLDREQLEQVLLNLAANARDAMPRGGRLTMTTANLVLDEAQATAQDCAAAGAYVVLTVTDTGVGMSPEVRERIFERFFTTKEPGHGTGIGLATARRFALRSGGCISVRTAPGQGTSVILSLPRAAPPAATLAPPRPTTPLPRGNETILVVEDDEHVRRVVRALLEGEGYGVLDAASGDAALCVAHGQGFDLVLADVVMPGMSGRTLVDKLHEAGHSAKVLYMSGHTDDALDAHGVNEGTDEIIRKAFSPSDLARRVREVLDAAS